MNIIPERRYRVLIKVQLPDTTRLPEIKKRHVDQLEKPDGSITSILLHQDRAILSHLFGRETTKYNLKDLLSLATCSLDTYIIILDFIQKLAYIYKNNDKFFIQECFKIQTPNDGIKTLMIKGLKDIDNYDYMTELENTFHNVFIEYLNNTNLTEASIKAGINRTIQCFHQVVKLQETSKLIDRILLDLYLAISEDNVPWQKLTRALSIIKKLTGNKDIASNNDILIKIANTAEALLSHTNWEVSNQAIWLIGSLAEAGTLDFVETYVLERFLINAIPLLEYHQTLSVLKQISEANLLESVDFKVIEVILFKLKLLLRHEQALVQYTTIWAIGVFAQCDALKGVNTDIIEDILLQAEQLLNHQEYSITLTTVKTINTLVKAGVVQRIEIKLLNRIFLLAKELFNHKQKNEANDAIIAITTFADSGCLEGLELHTIHCILLYSETLYDPKNHNQPPTTLTKILNLLRTRAEGGFINDLDFSLLERILLRISELLNYPSTHSVLIALLSLEALIEINLLKNIDSTIIDPIISQLEELVRDTNAAIFSLAVTTISQLIQKGFLKKIKPELINNTANKLPWLRKNKKYETIECIMSMIAIFTKQG